MSNFQFIRQVNVAVLLSSPPQYFFEIHGTIGFDKWGEFVFNNVIDEFQPEDKIQAVTMAAVASEDSIELENPMEFVTRLYYGSLPEWAVGLRFLAANNAVEKILVPQPEVGIDYILGEQGLLDRPVPWPWRKPDAKADHGDVDGNSWVPWPWLRNAGEAGTILPLTELSVESSPFPFPHLK